MVVPLVHAPRGSRIGTTFHRAKTPPPDSGWPSARLAGLTRSTKELEEAAHQVKGEWTKVAQMASLLPQYGERTLVETAALEATLVHTRCLIHFCCGGYEGRRNRHDIVPADFLGVDW